MSFRHLGAVMHEIRSQLFLACSPDAQDLDNKRFRPSLVPVGSAVVLSALVNF